MPPDPLVFLTMGGAPGSRSSLLACIRPASSVAPRRSTGYATPGWREPIRSSPC